MSEFNGTDLTRQDCTGIAPLLLPFASLSIDETGETLVRQHVAGCGACREALRAIDPSALFLSLRDEALPPAVWDGFQETLMARLPEGKPGAGWIGALRYPRLAYVAPVVAAILLGVTALVMRPGGMFGLRERGGAIPSPYAAPETTVRPGRINAPPAARLSIAGGERGTQGAPLLEEAGSPGARVYRFSDGGDADESPIYFVVDEKIDL